MIRVMCPHCERSYRTQTEGIGRTAVCTKCHQSFRIGDARPKFEWESTDLGEDSWIGVAAPEEKEERKHCFSCQAPMPAGAGVCPECGMNQVTGLVHRKAPKTEVEKPAWWHYIPIRPLVIVAVVFAFGGGLMWGIHALSKTAIEAVVSGDELGVLLAASRDLDEGARRSTMRRKYGHQVTDENIDRFAMNAMTAEDPKVGEAAVVLIGVSRATRLRPVLDYAKPEAGGLSLIPVLEAIGPARLIELSNHEDAEVREAAVEGLCWLNDLQCEGATRTALTEVMSNSDKLNVLNGMFRSWPRAVGRFTLLVNGQAERAPVEVRQYGRRFELDIGGETILSDVTKERTFTIPLGWWFVTMGFFEGGASLDGYYRGGVTLRSIYGVGWEGEIAVTKLRSSAGLRMGHLPVNELRANETASWPLKLEYE